MKKIKKVSFKKEVISNLEMDSLKGGAESQGKTICQSIGCNSAVYCGPLPTNDGCGYTIGYAGCYTGNSAACTIQTCTPTETTWYGG